ncbi:Gag protease polyprotein [Theobroma cacao]|uniref:Gag protease polyprotein n=1 Tax=Theobroma cacao TaxID=3641 RepID=A0A061DQ95_THECC|nr:Gag protease polyprotein [Theobroma cacao]
MGQFRAKMERLAIYQVMSVNRDVAAVVVGPRESQSDSIEEESVASSFRAVPTAEFIDNPVPHPPPVATPGVLAMSPEAAQALAAFCLLLRVKLKLVSETLVNMGLDDEMKLKVATRLFEKRARTWWNSIKSRSLIPLTWTDFLREFDGQYYTYFHQKEKKREFLSLKQGKLSIVEYETRFNELMLYAPELVRLEQDQVNYFEKGLRNEIRERMIVTGKESYKEVVQMALRAEKLATKNKRIRAEFAKRRNPPTFSDSGSDRSYVSISFASFSDRNLSPLEKEIVVHTPLGERLIEPGIVIYCHYLPVSGLGNLRACCLPWMW